MPAMFVGISDAGQPWASAARTRAGTLARELCFGGALSPRGIGMPLFVGHCRLPPRLVYGARCV